MVENLNVNINSNINSISTSSTTTQLTIDEEINRAFQIPRGTTRASSSNQQISLREITTVQHQQIMSSVQDVKAVFIHFGDQQILLLRPQNNKPNRYSTKTFVFFLAPLVTKSLEGKAKSFICTTRCMQMPGQCIRTGTSLHSAVTFPDCLVLL